jgi:hypothetical protein
MLLLRRIDGRLSIDAVSVRRLGGIEACLWVDDGQFVLLDDTKLGLMLT